jgi:hypothetical protein
VQNAGMRIVPVFEYVTNVSVARIANQMIFILVQVERIWNGFTFVFQIFGQAEYSSTSDGYQLVLGLEWAGFKLNAIHVQSAK